MVGAAVAGQGMALLVVKEAGAHDEHGWTRARTKTVESMQDLVNAFEVEQAFAPLAREDFSEDFVKKVGNGAVGFVKELELTEKPKMTDSTVRSDHVNRPGNSDAILDAIRKLLDGKEPLRVESEADLVVDILRREDTGEAVVHVLNVSHAKGEKASAKVWFRWPDRVRSVTEIRYDREPIALPFAEQDGGWAVEVADIEELSTVIVNAKGDWR